MPLLQSVSNNTQNVKIVNDCNEMLIVKQAVSFNIPGLISIHILIGTICDRTIDIAPEDGTIIHKSIVKMNN
jgi:hypothetical protein